MTFCDFILLNSVQRSVRYFNSAKTVSAHSFAALCRFAGSVISRGKNAEAKNKICAYACIMPHIFCDNTILPNFI